MANNMDDRPCGIYRSNDPIENFKIRVILERATPNSILQTIERIKLHDDLCDMLQNTKQRIKEPRATAFRTTDSDYEDVVINWQQKLFSHTEFNTYGRSIDENSTSREQKYFDQIKEMKAKKKQPGRIFTYVANDLYCDEQRFHYFMTDSYNEEPSPLAIGIDNSRRVLRAGRSNINLIARTHIVNHEPTQDDIRKYHLTSATRQMMYIMADISNQVDKKATDSISNLEDVDERVLCRICVYSNGIIVLSPDFNTNKTSYTIERGALHTDVYQYYLEHASMPITTEFLIKEKRLFSEIHRKQHRYLQNRIGEKFDTPPPDVLKVNIYGEIVSGKNFDYDGTYVYYALDLADNWFIESSNQMSGYTHAGDSVSSGRNDEVVYYSHLFEFELWYKPPTYKADHEIPRMPKIYFHIASLDAWGRHRTEGYTYMDIPNNPGFYNEHLSCWRPLGRSVIDESRRFFIGGSTELEDLSYVGIPKLFDNQLYNNVLSRFGFRTVSTGSLNVRLHVAFQSESIAKECRRRRHGIRGTRYGFNAFLSNIYDTIYEYEQAKQYALEVRTRVLKE